MEEIGLVANTGAVLIATLTEPIARSTAAERMRLHRERRRPGLRRILVESRVSEIDALIRKDFLQADARDDL
jgi:hypothetical protein